ncbi:hypothetical protein BN1723_010764 [Verticillium longisporum]|uniref:Uncharacterized protein n=1 Tax=Verticillium longisporum TaxID=100787 RepID=A0A0G4LYN1_VERLO|nr:hypothetical protein HYQ44_006295 [Verticillium longisporum]KAG7136625.1 hypothetical protein HYQ46_008663 [Verticillium longisporum]CRK15714.1 hypothetical protein BN1723_010764 [Verticillium longisporum]CRK26645.1 hypothetical protein BN1708_014613 [Verticillium longisporum]
MVVISQDVLMAAQKQLRQRGFHLPKSIILDRKFRAIWVALKAHPLCDGWVHVSDADLLKLKDWTASCLDTVFGTCISVIEPRLAIDHGAPLPDEWLACQVIDILVQTEPRWKVLSSFTDNASNQSYFVWFLYIYIDGREAYIKNGNNNPGNLSKCEAALLSTVDRLLLLFKRRQETYDAWCKAACPPSQRDASSKAAASRGKTQCNGLTPNTDAQPSTRDANRKGESKVEQPSSDVKHVQKQLQELKSTVETRFAQVALKIDAQAGLAKDATNRQALTTSSSIKELTAKNNDELNSVAAACSQLTKAVTTLFAKLDRQEEKMDEFKTRANAREGKAGISKETQTTKAAMDKTTQTTGANIDEERQIIDLEEHFQRELQNAAATRQNLQQVCKTASHFGPSPAEDTHRSVRHDVCSKTDFPENPPLVVLSASVDSIETTQDQATHAKTTVETVPAKIASAKPHTPEKQDMAMKQENVAALVDISASAPEPLDKAVQDILDLEKIMASFSV